MKRMFTMLLAIAGLALAAAPAKAHTNAFGFIPLPNGDVTFFIGTYGGHGNPGAFNLQGQLDITSVGSFLFTNTHNSTTAAALGLTAPGASYVTNQTGNPSSTPTEFMSVTVSGLVTGMYTINYSGTSGLAWDPSGSSFGANPLPGSFTVTVSNVPEPTSVVLFGLTALGMGFAARRRRRRKGGQAQVPAVS